MTTEPVSVLLVDDHDLVRQGLRHAFERDGGIDVLDETDTAVEALRLTEELQPDVTVMDVRLPDGNGLHAVSTMRAARRDIGIVVVTMYDDDQHLFAALDAGASAFVSKTATSADVVAAVLHAAARPLSFVAADLSSAMRRRMHPAGPQLTRREQEVLDLLAEGHGVSAIAGQLYISESTAKTHVARLYEKLGAANRAQAIMAAVRAGLLDQATASEA